MGSPIRFGSSTSPLPAVCRRASAGPSPSRRLSCWPPTSAPVESPTAHEAVNCSSSGSRESASASATSPTTGFAEPTSAAYALHAPYCVLAGEKISTLSAFSFCPPRCPHAVLRRDRIVASFERAGASGLDCHGRRNGRPGCLMGSAPHSAGPRALPRRLPHILLSKMYVDPEPYGGGIAARASRERAWARAL